MQQLLEAEEAHAPLLVSVRALRMRIGGGSLSFVLTQAVHTPYLSIPPSLSQTAATKVTAT